MPDKAIVDASPVIFLANAGFLDFLRSAAGEILLPKAVADEIKKGSEAELAVKAVDSSEWLRVVETPDVSPLVQTWDLGPGESAVLSYAHAHSGTVVVMDDLAGRRCAEALGIPVTGTLGSGPRRKEARDHLRGASRPGKTTRQRNVFIECRVGEGAYACRRVTSESRPTEFLRTQNSALGTQHSELNMDSALSPQHPS